MIREHAVDLVLLDVRMPDLDGYEVCRRIKEGERRNIPVVMITALTAKEERSKASRRGRKTSSPNRSTRGKSSPG